MQKNIEEKWHWWGVCNHCFQKNIILKATILVAPVHINCESGGASISQLKTYFNRREGFTIQFDGTDEMLTFSWKDVVDMAEDVYFFGPPQNGARRYEKLLKKNKGRIPTAGVPRYGL